MSNSIGSALRLVVAMVAAVMFGAVLAPIARAWTETETSGAASVTYTSSTTLTTISEPWPKASGELFAANGRVKVWGAGTLTPHGDKYQNNWVVLDCLEEVDGSLETAPEGYWKLHASYDFTLSADATYLDNGGALENYRSETTYTWEIKGDFAYFSERMVVVDSYSTPGSTHYDALGGGVNPTTYVNGGQCTIVTGPGPASGTQVCTVRYILGDTNQTYNGNLPDYFAYARGKQYIHNDEEEAVVQSTSIADNSGNSSKGWNGTLKAYKANGTLEASFPVVR